MNAELVILLSTFNGEKFLATQLDSLLRQSFRNWTLLIRDDGSTDGTIDLLKNYAERDSRIRLQLDRERLGPCQSFAKLLSAASAARWIFFCDQDDFWQPNKVELTHAALVAREAQLNAASPIAVHTDLAICDEQLNIIVPNMKAELPTPSSRAALLGRLLAQNRVTGCTLAINQSLCQAALPIPAEALMHDWWIALMAAALGEIIFLPEATVLYRQHGKNASGSAIRLNWRQGLQKFVAKRRDFEGLMRKRFRQSVALEERLEKIPAPEAREILHRLHNDIRQGRWSALRGAFRAQLTMDDTPRTLAFRSLVFKQGRKLLDR